MFARGSTGLLEILLWWGDFDNVRGFLLSPLILFLFIIYSLAPLLHCHFSLSGFLAFFAILKLGCVTR